MYSQFNTTTFNEVTPITTLHYSLEGSGVAFETTINLGMDILDVDNFQDGSTEVYIFEFDNNHTERIEIV
jgi:hypothetical protein